MRRLSLALCGLALLNIAASPFNPRAVTSRWDIIPNNGLVDEGGGTWNDASLFVFKPSGSNSRFVPSSNVAFGGGSTGTGGTVTAAGTKPLYSLIFNTANGATPYTLAGTLPARLGSNITVNDPKGATISAIIGGTMGVTKLGAQTLTLSGANTFTGNVAVNAGTLISSTGTPLPASTSSLGSVNNSLDIASGAQVNLTDTGNNYCIKGDLLGAGTLNQITGGSGVRLGGNNVGFSGTFTQASNSRYIVWDSATAGSAGATWNLNANTGSPIIAAAEYGNSAQTACPGFATGTTNTISLGTLSSTTTSLQLGNFGNGAGLTGTTTYSVGALGVNSTFAGAIVDTVGGSGAFTSSTVNLIKVGAGIQTLTGACTYSGTTTVSSGTLKLSNVGNGFVSSTSVASGATLEVNSSSGTADTMTLGNGNAGTQFTGTGTIDATGGGWITSDFNVMVNFVGILNILGGSTFGSSQQRGLFGNATSPMVVNLTSGFFDLRGAGANAIRIDQLNGGGSLCNTWNGSGAAGDTITVGTNNGSSTFSGPSRGAGGGTPNGFSCDAGIINVAKVGSGIFTLSGTNGYTGTTTVNGGTLRSGASTNVFGNNSAVTLANAVGAVLDLNDFNVPIGSLAGGGASGGNVTLGSGTLTTGGNNTSTSYAGVISGTGGVTKNGSGTQTLTGGSTFTGALTINNGVTGTTTGSIILGSGASLATQNINLGVGASAALNTFAVLQNGSANQLSSSAAMNFNGAVSKWAYWQLLGNSQTVDGLSDSSSNGVVENMESQVVNTNATLTLSGGANYFYNGFMRDKSSGAGTGTLSLVKNGSGTQTLSGNNIIYTGSTTINGGILQISDTANLGAGGSYNSAISIASGAQLKYSSSAAQTLFGVISGAGSILKDTSAASAVTLSGVNAYSGGTTVSTGTLTGTSTTPFGSGPITLGDGASGASAITLNYNSGGNTISNPITVSSSGSGTVTINQGVAFSVLNGLMTLNRATTLSGGGADRVDVSSKITGSLGTLTIEANPRITMSNTSANTSDFTGDVAITSGVLQLNTIYALPSTADVTVNTGTTFRVIGGANTTTTIDALNGSGTVNGDSGGANIAKTLSLGNGGGSGTFSGTIANGSGSDTLAISKAGTGTQSFSGTNTYTGVTTVTGGTLRFENPGEVTIGSTSGITISGGGNVTLSSDNNGANYTRNWTFTGTGGSIFLTQPALAKNFTMSGTITLNGPGEISGNKLQTTTISGVISGNSSLAFLSSGNNNFFLTGNNTYTGGTAINSNAIVTCGHINCLGAGTVTVNAGGSLNCNSFEFSNSIVNNGGTLQNCRRTFTSSGSYTIPSGVTSIQYLVVAGGGGGGGGGGANVAGGGGGAGGLLTGTVAVTPGNTYAITVGAGGTPNTTSTITNGGNSSIGSLVVAIGGGGGQPGGGHSTATGNAGGSGGGTVGTNGGGAGGAGTPGQGNAGGAGAGVVGNNQISGGGGGGAGGAGAAGSTASISAAGGVGVSNSLSGSAVTYAAGGIGGRSTGSASGANGAANRGNGGGAGDGVLGTTATAGSGGSGIVIILLQ